MLARNAFTLIGAITLTAAVAGAQQPAKQPPATHTTATQASPQAKKTSKTSAATAMPISTDSAKKIVVANAAGATVSSAKLHKSDGKAYYAVSYKMKGNSKTMHATVDANTGAFAPGSSAPPAKSSAKKPS